MDSFFQRPELGGQRQTTDGAILMRVEVTDDLIPGGKAPCNPVYFDGTNWKANTKITMTAYDPFFFCCALKAHSGSNPDRLWAIWRPDMVGAGAVLDRIEIAGEHGLEREAKLTAPLAAGGNATAHLYLDSTDTGVAITAFDWTCGAAANGAKIQVQYEPGLRQWRAVAQAGRASTLLLAKWTGATIWNPGTNSSNAVEVFAGGPPETDQFTTVTAYNRFHTIMPGDFVLVAQNADAWYVLADFSDVLFGQMQSTNLAPGGTGTFHVLDPSTGTGGAAFTDTGLTVTAYTAVPLVKNDVVMLFWNRINTTNNYAFYAVPLSRPLLGKATATINYQASGTVEVYDSADVDLGTSVSAYATQRQIAKNEWCTLFFDTNKQKWVAYPLNVPILGQNQSSGGTTPIAKGSQITTFEVFDDQFNDQSFSLSNVRALADIGAKTYCKAFWDSINNEFYAEPLSLRVFGHMGGSGSLSTSGTVALWGTNYTWGSNGITVNTGTGKFTILRKGVYLTLWTITVTGASGDFGGHLELTGIGGSNLNNGAAGFASGAYDLQIPTHVNLTTGNPDTFNGSHIEYHQTKISLNQLNAGDVVTCDQVTHGTDGAYAMDVILMMLDDA